MKPIITRGSLLLSFLLLNAAAAWAQTGAVQVTPDDVREQRTSSPTYDGGDLTIGLDVEGGDVKKALYLRALAKSATDNVGKNLLKMPAAEEGPRVTKFRKADFGLQLELQKAERQATQIEEVSGVVQMFFPQRDAQSVVTFTGFRQRAGRALQAPAFEAGELEITLLTPAQSDAYFAEQEKKIRAFIASKTGDAKFMAEFGLALLKSSGNLGEKGVTICVNDPRFRLVDIQFEDENGQSLSHNTLSSDTIRVYEFERKVPATARLKIYVTTSKSLIAVPFQFRDLKLP